MQGTPEEVFERADELLEMGLNVPEVTKIFLSLQKKGYHVEPVYTVDAAVSQIQSLLGGGKP